MIAPLSLTDPLDPNAEDFPSSPYVKEFHPSSPIGRLYTDLLKGEMGFEDSYFDVGTASFDPRRGYVSNGDFRITATEVLHAAVIFAPAYDSIAESLKKHTGIEIAWRLSPKRKEEISKKLEQLSEAVRKEHPAAGERDFSLALARAIFEFVKKGEPEGLGFPPPELEEERDRYSMQYPTVGARDEDCRTECTAEEALTIKEGWCTESTKILLTVYSLAGFRATPIVVFQDEKKVRMDHTALRLELPGKKVVVDLSLNLFDAPHRDYLPITEAQFLAVHYDNRATDRRKNFKRKEEAFDDHVRAAALSPDDPFILSNYAKDLYALGGKHRVEALRTLREAAALNDSLVPFARIDLPHVTLGQLLRQEAEELLRIAATMRRQEARWRKRGVRHHKRAEELTDDVVRKDTLYRYYLEKAWTYRNDPEASRSPSAEMIARQSEEIALEYLAEERYLLSESQIERRRAYRKLAITFQKLADEAKVEADTAAVRGRELYDEALAHLERAQQIDPRSSRAHTNYGYALFKGIESGLIPKELLEKALDHLRKGIQFKPTSAEARVNLAKVLLSDEDISNKRLNANEAKESLNAAIHYNPLDPAPYRLLARSVKKADHDLAEQLERQARVLETFGDLPPWDTPNLDLQKQGTVIDKLASGKGEADVGALTELGKRAFAGGFVKEAILFFGAARKVLGNRSSTLAEIDFHLGATLLVKSVARGEDSVGLGRDQRQQARTLLEEAIRLGNEQSQQLHPYYLEALFYLGYAIEKEGHFDEAVKKYRELIARIPAGPSLASLNPGWEGKLREIREKTVSHLADSLLQISTTDEPDGESLRKVSSEMKRLVEGNPENREAREKWVRLLQLLRRQTKDDDERNEIDSLIVTQQSMVRVLEGIGRSPPVLKNEDARWANVLGLELHAIGDSQRSLRYFQAAVSLKPSEAAFFYDMLGAIYRVGGHDAVLTALRKRQMSHPAELRAYLLSAKMKAHKADYAGARAELQTASTLQLSAVEWGEFRLYRGWVFFQEAQSAKSSRRRTLLEAAVADFRTVVGSSPQRASAHYHLGRSLLTLDRAEEALRHFTLTRQHMASGFEDLPYFEGLAKVSQARERLADGQAETNGVEALLDSALVDLKEAKETWQIRNGRDLDYSLDRSWYFYGEALLLKARFLKNTQERKGGADKKMDDLLTVAGNHFHQALIFKPDSPDSVNSLAEVFDQKGERDVATLLKVFAARYPEGLPSSYAFVTNPPSPAYVTAGRLLAQAEPREGDARVKKYYAESVERIYQKALEGDPTQENLRRLFDVQVKNGKTGEAIAMANEWAGRESDQRLEDAEVYFKMGEIYRKRGKMEEAVEHYRKGWRRNKNCDDCLFWTVVVLIDMDDRDAAEEELAKAMKESGGDLAPEKIEEIRRLLSSTSTRH